MKRRYHLPRTCIKPASPLSQSLYLSLSRFLKFGAIFVTRTTHLGRRCQHLQLFLGTLSSGRASENVMMGVQRESDRREGRRLDEVRTRTASTAADLDRDTWVETCCNEKKKHQRHDMSDVVVALTVNRRFSVRGDGGGMFVAIFAELGLFRECSKCWSRGSLDVYLSKPGDLPKIFPHRKNVPLARL